MENVQVLDGLRVLAVDDNADTLDLLKFTFEEFNAQVTTATSVSVALEEVERYKPNILISDLAMPVEDGYSLIRKVRSLTKPTRQIPAIALTAMATEESRTLALNAGFNSHIVKPFDPEELIAVTSNLALVALYDTCPACGITKLSFIEYESKNKIWFQCPSCKWNRFYKLNTVKDAGFVNPYH
ncbi:MULTISPECIES: response regulator [Nostocales]|uniref:Response regulator n=3 Tax=Nostocales TaxID=1161 RepID=A0A8S9SZD8_9CYAN|nr:response regulator [Tolypothrix bouteillei]KAF3885741.1 response regulator [Tolypothrix bouteillei VB521301]